MPKIRYLKIRFANTLMPYEAPAFRAAVIEATGRQSILFHNHLPTEGFKYQYPLIQYKITERKAGIVCLNQATDDIHYLLQNRELDLRIGRRRERFEIEDVQLRYHHVQIWQAGFHYSLRHWQALNQQNYRQYAQLQTEVERLQFLENLLRANLLSFATGIARYAEDPIEARITQLKGEKWLTYKGTKVLCFSLNFLTNVSLPDYVGLGKGVSVGFGNVLQFGSGKWESGNGKAEGGNFTRPRDEDGRKAEVGNEKWEVGNRKAEDRKDSRSRTAPKYDNDARRPYPARSRGRSEAEQPADLPTAGGHEHKSDHTL